MRPVLFAYTAMNTNPLLTQGTLLTDFASLHADHVTPALDELLAAANAALARVVGPDVALDYDTISTVLDVPVERLRAAWGHVGFLQSVADTPALRAAHADNLPRVTDFFTRLGADAGLFAKYKALAASAGAVHLSAARHKVLNDALRDFVLGGAELTGASRERFAAIQERSSALSQTFGDHVLDATDAFELLVTGAELDGVPDDVRSAAKARAAGSGRDGCLLNLQAPCYQPLMQYATNRPLREQLYRASNTRASEQGPAALDNTPVITELLALREEEAALLGLPSYAHLSLVPKMAQSPAEVVVFLRDLAARARPFAEREWAALQSFASAELGLSDVQAWDRAFASEKLKQSLYAFSSSEVKQYFTEPRVLQGLLELVQRLFDISIEPATAPVWHEDVRFYSVARGGVPIAGFYLDLHARPGKGSGAWMDEARCRWRRPDGHLQLPLAHLVCNFAPPVGDQPALLTHDDVITLFHEFGHGLHHMLTQVDELAVSGIAGVEWDAAELPSQFMENFCWEWDVLQRLTAHVQTAEALPRPLFERMLAARNFQNGLSMLRSCEMSLFDMRLHLEAGAAQRVQALAIEVNTEMAMVPAPDFNRYPQTFSHLFDGGYAAGYYGYSWAEVLSADAYSAFEEAGVFDAATGTRYREQILERGGSRSTVDSFKAFRGRAPQLDALLRHQGLALLCMFMCTLLMFAGSPPAVAQTTAQYKVVQPDGSITYTDRPPPPSSARVSPMRRSTAGDAPEAAFPAELRQAVQRYPVTLYTAADCAPCASGRAWLIKRGVPFNERRVVSEDDAVALERLVGGRSVPSLTIGAQPARGWSETDWAAYLDVAGYPRESKLPRGWLPAPALPLVERAAAAPAAPAAPPLVDTRPVEPPPAPGGVRF